MNIQLYQSSPRSSSNTRYKRGESGLLCAVCSNIKFRLRLKYLNTGQYGGEEIEMEINRGKCSQEIPQVKLSKDLH